MNKIKSVVGPETGSCVTSQKETRAPGAPEVVSDSSTMDPNQRVTAAN